MKHHHPASLRDKSIALLSVSMLTLALIALSGCAGSFFGKPARDFIEVADISQVPESDPFTMRDVKIERDSLKFIASYGGGCREHVFTLYAARAKDSVNTGLLYVQHNGNNDLCRAVVSDDTVGFSLKGLKSALGLKGGGAQLVLVPGAVIFTDSSNGYSLIY
jgi:hypothetical protein